MKPKAQPKVSDHLPKADTPRVGWHSLGNGGRVKRTGTDRDKT